MPFEYKIDGTVCGIQEDEKQGGFRLKVQHTCKMRFDLNDESPAPVLVRVPRHVSIDGISFGTPVEITGEAAVSVRGIKEKNNFGKETGREFDRYAYYFEAAAITVKKAAKV